ncbi:hypothetical protein [Microcoleus sp. Pol10D4]|uniref:hypothetical protein n=1 Tax=Microcoleus sp. Pol10D4 TaxID=3055387 RepID=UPI002FCF0DFE
MKKALNSPDKFQVAINKILAQEYNESVGKAQITKILNQWEKEEKGNIKETINAILTSLDIPKWANWIHRRFTCVLGSYWLESSSNKSGDTVLGWYDVEQFEAESLPLALYYQRWDEERYCKVLGWGETWEAKGFVEAVQLPFICGYDVEVPVEELQFYCEHGYASPCKLQWERVDNRVHTETNGYYVTRSIIPYGFWQAWKWWPDAWAWYYERRPELFEDEVLWRAKEWPMWHSPSDNPYAAVLGTASRNRPTFFLDD